MGGRDVEMGADAEEPVDAPQRTKICVTFFLLFSAFGILLPFLPVFMHQAQMSDSQIGFLFAAQRLVGAVATPITGHLADHYKAHRSVLLICLGLSTCMQLMLLPAAAVNPLDARFTALLLVTVINATLASSTPILDSFAMHAMGGATEYGETRLWGAVGFGVCSLLGGLLVQLTTWTT